MINSELSDKLIVFLLLMLITHAVDQTTDNRRVKWWRNGKNCLESAEMWRGYFTYIVQRRLAHHQAHGLAAVPHQLDHVVPRGSEQKIFRHNHRKYLGREKYCEQSVPGHVLAVDGENLVAGHELVHAGAAASHEPGTGNSFQLSLDQSGE